MGLDSGYTEYGESGDRFKAKADPYDGEEEKQYLSPNKSKLDVLSRHARKFKAGRASGGSNSSNASPDKRFKSSFMNNVETGSPDFKPGRMRDTANVDLDLDMDSGDSEQEFNKRSSGDSNEEENTRGLGARMGNKIKSGVKTGIELLRLDKIAKVVTGEDDKEPKIKSNFMANMMRMKNTMIKNTLKNKRKKWNFAEFYEVSENEDELKVRAHIEYKK
jgi:hypothetical protein